MNKLEKIKLWLKWNFKPPMYIQYFNKPEDCEKEYQILEAAKKKYFEENKKYLMKFDEKTGLPYKWNVKVKREYSYDKETGDIILGKINVTIYGSYCKLYDFEYLGSGEFKKYENNYSRGGVW